MLESGGHRWQRIPPTERKGRVHTSTVTVAVIPKGKVVDLEIRPEDLEEFVQRGSGPGGQHRNKTESCVTLRHKPTGIEVRIDMRSQHRSRAKALQILTERVLATRKVIAHKALNGSRADQIGSGMRGDKIRTYREQDGMVTDHRSGNKTRLSIVLKGDLDKLINK